MDIMMFNPQILLICGTPQLLSQLLKKQNLHPEGAIFARGACDDKGQMYMHVKALRIYDLHRSTCLVM